MPNGRGQVFQSELAIERAQGLCLPRSPPGGRLCGLAQSKMLMRVYFRARPHKRSKTVGFMPV